MVPMMNNMNKQAHVTIWMTRKAETSQWCGWAKNKKNKFKGFRKYFQYFILNDLTDSNVEFVSNL